MPYDPSRHGPHRIVGPGFHARVHALVRAVPPGRVTTYGDLAAALGRRGIARQVGYALAAVSDDSVPWWRVVAANGRLARAGTAAARRQAALLRREGVTVRADRVAAFAQRRFAPAAPSS
jgi:methylated-DNA-protein-cysteine methyltransferase-like protein